ncbi:hypothetical protein T4D_11037 [Trichinella pseudospiralis]|uniref:Uncharacterized protein n=1 Tax=Trichinella pseudospiralis TaxID=6337 RepID=A0A0V1FNL6_TRIPS|nr:hypothetical protein T4D_11037 [Trichinella pseudospiralis]
MNIACSLFKKQLCKTWSTASCRPVYFSPHLHAAPLTSCTTCLIRSFKKQLIVSSDFRREDKAEPLLTILA